MPVRSIDVQAWTDLQQEIVDQGKFDRRELLRKAKNAFGACFVGMAISNLLETKDEAVPVVRIQQDNPAEPKIEKKIPSKNIASLKDDTSLFNEPLHIIYEHAKGDRRTIHFSLNRDMSCERFVFVVNGMHYASSDMIKCEEIDFEMNAFKEINHTTIEESGTMMRIKSNQYGSAKLPLTRLPGILETFATGEEKVKISVDVDLEANPENKIAMGAIFLYNKLKIIKLAPKIKLAFWRIRNEQDEIGQLAQK